MEIVAWVLKIVSCRPGTGGGEIFRKRSMWCECRKWNAFKLVNLLFIWNHSTANYCYMRCNFKKNKTVNVPILMQKIIVWKENTYTWNKYGTDCHILHLTQFAQNCEFICFEYKNHVRCYDREWAIHGHHMSNGKKKELRCVQKHPMHSWWDEKKNTDLVQGRAGKLNSWLV